MGSEYSHRIRVLLLVNTFDVGGAERIYGTLANQLPARGYVVTAACLRAQTGRLLAGLDRSKVTIQDLDAASRFDVRPWIRLYRLLRQEHPEVLYTFNFHAHVMGRIVGRLAGARIVLSAHQTLGWEGPVRELANRVTARWCTRIVAASGLVENYLRERVRIPQAKLITIRNGIHLRPFVSLPAKPMWRQGVDGGPHIGSVARLSREKGHDTLLDAFVHVRQKFPSSRLILAGDGTERARLLRQAEALGVSSSVVFLGHVQDVRSVYAQLDVYVQASRAEGLPCAVLEALASALPLVATRVGGTEEAVPNGECGLLVPPDDPAALAEAICWILDHPAKAEDFAERGRRRALALFDAETMVDATDQLIRGLLSGSLGERFSH